MCLTLIIPTSQIPFILGRIVSFSSNNPIKVHCTTCLSQKEAIEADSQSYQFKCHYIKHFKYCYLHTFIYFNGFWETILTGLKFIHCIQSDVHNFQTNVIIPPSLY